jgi:phosphoenolpyruvate synthase/pyruvate phosphate dikinase
VTPDTFVAHKPSLRILRRQVYDKEIEVVPDPSGRGTVTMKVPPHRASIPTLEEKTIVEVAGLAATSSHTTGGRSTWSGPSTTAASTSCNRGP